MFVVPNFGKPLVSAQTYTFFGTNLYFRLSQKLWCLVGIIKHIIKLLSREISIFEIPPRGGGGGGGISKITIKTPFLPNYPSKKHAEIDVLSFFKKIDRKIAFFLACALPSDFSYFGVEGTFRNFLRLARAKNGWRKTIPTYTYCLCRKYLCQGRI